MARTQAGELDAVGQLEVGQVDDATDRQLGQVDLDELRQVLRQAQHLDVVQFVRDHDARGLAGRGRFLPDEVERNLEAHFLGLADALEVDVQDLGLERVALEVAQQDLLHVALDRQVQDR